MYILVSQLNGKYQSFYDELVNSLSQTSREYEQLMQKKATFEHAIQHFLSSLPFGSVSSFLNSNQ
jgi:hypothetical protein